MIVTCQLRFDAELHDSLSRARRKVAAQGLCPKKQGGAPPHITLGHWDVGESGLSGEAVEVLKALPEFPIRFAGVGLFAGECPTVFLVPQITDDLLAAYKRVHHLLGRCGASHSPFYRPEQWTPHCVMALQVDRPSALEATALLMEMTVPIQGKVSSVSVCETDGPELQRISLVSTTGR